MNYKVLRQLTSIETEDCVLWPFPPSGNGYGQLQVQGKRNGPHWFVCRDHHGPPPTPAHQAAHSCNTPLCVNPRHLRWATPKENAADRVANGTAQRGESGTLARLTTEQVRDIRTRTSESSTALGREFGVTEACIRRIVQRKTWAWLDEALFDTPIPDPAQMELAL